MKPTAAVFGWLVKAVVFCCRGNNNGPREINNKFEFVWAVTKGFGETTVERGLLTKLTLLNLNRDFFLLRVSNSSVEEGATGQSEWLLSRFEIVVFFF